MKSTAALLLFFLWCGVSHGCDLGLSWVTEKETSSKLLSPKAVSAMIDQMVSRIESSGALPRDSVKTVALTAVEIDQSPGDSTLTDKETHGLRQQVVDAVSKAFESHQFKVVQSEVLAAAIAPEPISPDGFLSPPGMELARQKLSASLFLRVRLTDYRQTIQLDRSTLPGQQNRFRRHLIQSVKGRLSLQDDSGRYLHIGEATGQIREGTVQEGEEGLAPSVGQKTPVTTESR